MPKPESTRRPAPMSLSALGSEFAAKCLRAERCALAAGWYDPVTLRDAAAQAGLRVEHFAAEHLAWFFRLLCEAADTGTLPSVADVARAARVEGVDLEADDIFTLILCTDALPRDLPIFCESVVDYAEQRAAAIEAFHVYRHIIRPKWVTSRGAEIGTRFPVRRLSI